jgi:hypothetical protein
MNGRVEAAASAMWEQRPMRRDNEGAPVPFSEMRESYYRPRYIGQADVALAAADAVMFSDEAVERAAKAVSKDFPWHSNYNLDVVQHHVRAIVAELRGGANGNH